MKKHFVVILLVLSTISVAEDKIKFGIGSSSQRVNDISFEFSTKKGDLIRMQIDQITSKGQNIAFEIKDLNYFDYLKWLTGLSSAEMRGFKAIVIIPNESIDFNSSIERTHFEIKNIDVLIDEENEKVDLNSLYINYKLTNLVFSVPYFNESEVDEFINTLIPDGKIPKFEFSISYNKIDKTLKINGNFRMLSGNGILNVSLMINENDIELIYVEKSSIKLNNVADGLVDYINDIKNETNFNVTKLGRGSFKIEYSGLLKNISSRYLESSTLRSEELLEDALISSLQSAVEIYAMDQFIINSKKSYPDNPFDELDKLPSEYTGIGILEQSGEWVFTRDNYIAHQRMDNSKYKWYYDRSNGEIGNRIIY